MDGRAALVAQFYALSIERLARIRAAVASGPAEVGWGHALGELHTMKGEARMLGLDEISRDVHAIEGMLAGVTGPSDALALDRIDALAGAVAARPSSPGDSPSAPRPAAPELGYVRLAHVDAVCEALEELGALVRDGDLRARVEKALDAAFALRLAAIGPTLEELAVHARALAREQGKDVVVRVDGGSLEIERTILESLKQALLHVIRNAIDHGIELPAERLDKPRVGTLSISVAPRADTVEVTVTDDGRGIAVDALRDAARAAGVESDGGAELVFEHGVSTRAQADELSGRGLGLAHVRRWAESIGGSVGVESLEGFGTEITVTVPISIAREHAVIVEVDGRLFAFPSRYVAGVFALGDDDAPVRTPTGEKLPFGDDLVPVTSFGAAIGASGGGREERSVVVLRTADATWAFTVQAHLGERELLRKPAGALLSAHLVGASAVLDDGRLVLVAHVPELIRRGGRAKARPSSAHAKARAPRALVVDDSSIVRHVLRELLEGAGLEVEEADTGRAALARIEAREPDVVLTDLEMPEMTGLELLAKIRERSRRLPVIMITTRGSAEDRARAAELGADAYVVKADFRSPVLVDTVRRFVGGVP